MSATYIYDGGRDGFLATSTSKPPSKFDSIEYLERDALDKSSIASSVATAAAAAGKAKRCGRISPAAGGRYSNTTAGKIIYSSNASAASSNVTTAVAWSWGDDGNDSSCDNTEGVTHATSSWREEVCGSRRKKPSTAPSSASACSKHGKKFYWGPRVTPQGQEIDRDVRGTNEGEPVTFALCVHSVEIYPLLGGQIVDFVDATGFKEPDMRNNLL